MPANIANETQLMYNNATENSDTNETKRHAHKNNRKWIKANARA